MRLATLLLTHEKIDHTKIGMQIIKKLWSKNTDLKKVDIYHAYNGTNNSYPHIFLEKTLIRRKNLGHFEGAGDLIDSGINEILKTKDKYDFILVMSGDVWITKPQILDDILCRMQSESVEFASTLWPNFWFTPCFFASEFFIITPSLATKVFPLNMTTYYQARYFDHFLDHFSKIIPIVKVPRVEKLLTTKVLRHTSGNIITALFQGKVKLFPGRRIMYGLNRFHSPQLGYLSHHNLEQKKLLLKKYLPEIEAELLI